MVQGNVDGAADVGGVPFLVATDVQDDHRTVTPDRFQGGEVRDGVAAQRPAAGPVIRVPGGGRGGSVDADPDQLALGLGDLLGSLAQQGQRRAPGDQPAQVGGEAAVQVEAERAGHVPGGESPAGPQVHHPLSRLDAPPQLGGVGAARRGQVRSDGPAALAGPMCA